MLPDSRNTSVMLKIEAAWRGAPQCWPLRQRLGRDPQRRAPPAAQARFVLGPVRHTMRHLRDVMPAIGVVLVQHASASE